MTIEELLRVASKENTEVLMYESLTQKFSKVIFMKKQYFFTYEEGETLQAELGARL
ncbi:hypothetical protein AB6C47_018205 [Vibrio cyclitrophicus]